MSDRFAAALSDCASVREARRLLIAAEDELAPVDIARLVAAAESFPPHVREAMDALPLVRRLRARAPEPYRRRPLSESITFYDSTVGRPWQKTLLVVFCGQRNRAMLPTAGLLQCLPARRFDVVFVVDPRRQHHLGGHPGYAADLPGLVAALARDLRPERYRRRVSLGTSMGGLAALRYGKLAGVDRAVAIGALPAWHIHRLLDPTARTVQAYDPLCACTAGGPVEMVCIYSQNNRDDRDTATLCAIMAGARRVPIPDAREHNVLNPMWQNGGLRAFLRRHLDDADDGLALRARRAMRRLRAMIAASFGRDERLPDRR